MSKDMSKEWYLLEYEDKTYLHNRVLVFRENPCTPGHLNDHEHCELCWDRFGPLTDDLKKGYYEPISRSWICPNCFSSFSSLFGWTADDSLFSADSRE